MARASNLTMCSFCGKSHAEVRKLIAGPGVHICGDCVKIRNSILAGLPSDGFAGWEQLADDARLGPQRHPGVGGWRPA